MIGGFVIAGAVIAGEPPFGPPPSPGHGVGGDRGTYRAPQGGDRSAGGSATSGDYSPYTGTGGDRPTGGM